MKIVVLDGYCLNNGDLSWSGFEALGELKVYDRTDYKDIISRIGDSEIVITNKTPIDRNIVESTNIKYIGVLATGYNIIDMDSCNEHNITVCNIPSYSTDGVVQLTFALLFELINKVYIHSQSVKAGEWTKCSDFSYTIAPLIELSGKTMGLIGYGSIGKAVAKAAQGFNINVIYNKPSGADDNDTDKCHYADMDSILAESDIISLHCPLTNDTREIINSNSISKMKKNVVIINTARGGVINETDLASALNDDRISGYGCDVLSNEPPSIDNVIINAKNTVITPHIAWQGFETRERLMNIAVSNLACYLKGNVQNKV